MAKRQVEVFTAGCPMCDPAVAMVKATACPHCEVTVYDLNETGMEKARNYGLKTVPAVVIDGTVCSCCDNKGINEADLRAAGLGTPIS